MEAVACKQRSPPVLVSGLVSEQVGAGAEPGSADPSGQIVETASDPNTDAGAVSTSGCSPV